MGNSPILTIYCQYEKLLPTPARARRSFGAGRDGPQSGKRTIGVPYPPVALSSDRPRDGSALIAAFAAAATPVRLTSMKIAQL